MADVFLSYSRLDEGRVAAIAERLTSLGHSVAAHDKKTAEAELNAARAVLTVWSRNARNSMRVRAEAAHAAERGVLLQMRLDGLDAPAPFNALHCANMGGDRGEWGALEDALSQTVRGGGTPPVLRVGGVVGAPSLVLLALATGFAAIAAAMAPTAQNVLTSEQFAFAVLGVGGVGVLCTLISLWRLVVALRAGL